MENILTKHENFIITRDRDTREIFCDCYEDENVMFRILSRSYAFMDCDDTIEVVMICCDNREVEYVGWRPGMEFTYRYVESGDEIWTDYFPEYDH